MGKKSRNRSNRKSNTRSSTRMRNGNGGHNQTSPEYVTINGRRFHIDEWNRIKENWTDDVLSQSIDDYNPHKAGKMYLGLCSIYYKLDQRTSFFSPEDERNYLEVCKDVWEEIMLEDIENNESKESDDGSRCDVCDEIPESTVEITELSENEMKLSNSSTNAESNNNDNDKQDTENGGAIGGAANPEDELSALMPLVNLSGKRKKRCPHKCQDNSDPLLEAILDAGDLNLAENFRNFTRTYNSRKERVFVKIVREVWTQIEETIDRLDSMMFFVIMGMFHTLGAQNSQPQYPRSSHYQPAISQRPEIEAPQSTHEIEAPQLTHHCFNPFNTHYGDVD